jgi:diguanylate cyclase (GGDEF)-like protein
MFTKLLILLLFFSFSCNIFANNFPYKEINKQLEEEKIIINKKDQNIDFYINYIQSNKINLKNKINSFNIMKIYFSEESDENNYIKVTSILEKLMKNNKEYKEAIINLYLEKIDNGINNKYSKINISNEFFKLYQENISEDKYYKYKIKESNYLTNIEKYYNALDILNKLEKKEYNGLLKVYFNKYKIYKKIKDYNNQEKYIDILFKYYEDDTVAYDIKYIDMLVEKKKFNTEFNIEPYLKKILSLRPNKELYYKAKMIDLKTSKNNDKIKTIDEILLYYKKSNQILKVKEANKIKSCILNSQNKSNEALSILDNIPSAELNEDEIFLYIDIHKKNKNHKESLKYILLYEKIINENYKNGFSKSIKEIKKMFKILEKENETNFLTDENKNKNIELIKEKKETILINKIIVASYVVLSIIVIISILSIIGYRKLKKKATIDELTGIYNEKTIITKGKKELSCKKEKYISVILLKIKNLEDYNNKEEKDKILKEVSLESKKMLRKEDSVGRFKEDSFLIISKNNKKISERIASRIVDKINKETTSQDINIIYRIVQKKKKETDFSKLINILEK